MSIQIKRTVWGVRAHCCLQACIDDIESECSKLLKTILLLNHPKISSILISHLTPTAVSATAFVRLYGKVTSIISAKNVDFVLSVLSKVRVVYVYHVYELVR